jgi:hypothetical protein
LICCSIVVFFLVALAKKLEIGSVLSLSATHEIKSQPILYVNNFAIKCELNDEYSVNISVNYPYLSTILV